MATAASLERVTAINKAGHRHIRSAYYSGTTMALEGVWGWQKPSGFLALHPAIGLVDFNGAPAVRSERDRAERGVPQPHRPAAAARNRAGRAGFQVPHPNRAVEARGHRAASVRGDVDPEHDVAVAFERAQARSSNPRLTPHPFL